MSVVGIDYCCICFMLWQYGVSWCCSCWISFISRHWWMFRTLCLTQDTLPALLTPHSSPGLHFPPLVVLYFSYERFAPLLRCGPPHCSVMLRNNGLIKVRPCRVKWFRCVHTSIHSGLAPSLRQSAEFVFRTWDIPGDNNQQSVGKSSKSVYFTVG